MIEWIVTSSALILLVILLRVLVKNRIGPRLRYALWGLVLLRLLLPGTLWESRASVMTPVAAQEEFQAVERIPRYIRTRPDGWTEIGHNKGYTYFPPARIEDGGQLSYYWPPVKASLEDLQKQVGIRNGFLLAWLTGAAAMGIFLLAVNLKFNRALQEKRRSLTQYRGRWVFVMEGLASPCLFGLFHPTINLTPDVAADEAAREHVLAHEYAHFRQGDHIWAALRGVCLALHWYNPLVWLAAYLSRRDCELSCDEGAVRLLGEDRRADYGRTLVGLVARRTTPKDLACCATTMTGGRSALKERIALLVKRPRTTVLMACIVAAACIVFAACTFTGAAEEEAELDAPADPVQTQELEPPSQPEAQPLAAPTSREELTAMTQRLLEEQLRNSEGVLDCRVNFVNVTEWRFDLNSGDRQAAFGAELMVLAEPEHQETWLAGNGVYAGAFNDVFYNDYDGWIVFWWTGYLTYDAASGEGAIPVTATGGCNLDDIDGDLGLRTDGRNYLRFMALPDDLPTELMDLDRPLAEQNEWLLLAQAPTVDAALYRTKWKDDRHVYLRLTNQCFQVFDQDLSEIELLPTLDVVEGDADLTVRALYRRYEGTYFNGQTYEPGIVAEQVFYEWSEAGKYWIAWAIASQPPQSPTEDVPALADLPTEIVRPETEDAEMQPIEEVPETDIPVDPASPALTDTFRAILAKTWEECDKTYTNVYSIHDVNADGVNELIVRWMPAGATSSAWGTSVYDANGQELFHGFGELTFYNNGAISEPWSHNQGQATAIWPYDLYRYDPATGSYVQAGSARAISSQMESFPREADLDGDGMVYYIGEDAYREENPVDNDVYEAWRGRYLAGEQVLPLRYYDLTEDAVS